MCGSWCVRLGLSTLFRLHVHTRASCLSTCVPCGLILRLILRLILILPRATRGRVARETITRERGERGEESSDEQ